MSVYILLDIIGIIDQVDWKLTRISFSISTAQRPSPSFHYQSEIIFKLKNLYHLLLTLSYLKLTQPHLYQNTTCPLYLIDNEDWLHVYLCPRQLNTLLDCIDVTTDFASLRVNNYITNTSSFKRDFKTLNIWNVPSKAYLVNYDQFSIVDLL